MYLMRYTQYAQSQRMLKEMSGDGPCFTLMAFEFTFCGLDWQARSEGFGLTVAEAMAHGVPAMVGSYGALAETLVDQSTGQNHDTAYYTTVKPRIMYFYTAVILPLYFCYTSIILL
jgi:hypothetical protein